MTEATAALLNLLPRDALDRLIMVHFLPQSAWTEFQQLVKERSLIWRSQVRIFGAAEGQLDLLLEAEGVPIVAIEVKIGASFTPDQLQRYGRWIGARNRTATWPGALTLLTYRTAGPDDFESNTANYGVPYRKICHWSELHLWLRQFVGNGRGLLPAPRFLARELYRFLEEHNMAAETITPTDLASIELYVPTSQRLNSTFRTISQRVIATFPSLIGNPHGLVFSSDGLCVWDWAYLVPSMVPDAHARWFIYWGIVFPGVTEWWAEVRPVERSAVVGLGAENENRNDIPLPIGRLAGIPEGWQRTPEDLANFQPFSAFVSENGELAEGMADWIVIELEKVRPVIGQLRDAVAGGGS